MVCVVLGLGFGGWDLEFGVWDFGFDVGCLGYDACLPSASPQAASSRATPAFQTGRVLPTAASVFLLHTYADTRRMLLAGVWVHCLEREY